MACCSAVCSPVSVFSAWCLHCRPARSSNECGNVFFPNNEQSRVCGAFSRPRTCTHTYTHTLEWNEVGSRSYSNRLLAVRIVAFPAPQPVGWFTKIRHNLHSKQLTNCNDVMPTICGVVCAVPHSVLLDIYLAVTYRIYIFFRKSDEWSMLKTMLHIHCRMAREIIIISLPVLK